MKRWRLGVIAGAACLIAATSLSGTATAHNYPGTLSDGGGPCNKDIKWATASQTYYYALVWNGDITRGTQAAGDAFSVSQFHWSYSSSSPNTWNNLNSSDTSIAGATNYTSIDCTRTPGQIKKVTFYWNLPHFNSGHGSAGTATRQNFMQCTATHEFGHGLGLRHNTYSPSIMYQDHGTRCHTNSWRTLQTHDISDINAKY